MTKKPILFILIAPLLGILLGLGQAFYLVKIWSYQGAPTPFEIKKGENFARINYRLGQKEFISSPKLFYHYAKFQDVLTLFKPGMYTIEKDMNMDQVIALFLKGVQSHISVTIPEGKNLFEIAQILDDQKILNKAAFIKAAKDADLMKQLGIPAERAEGYLYPETYFFDKDMAPENVIKIMVETFGKKTAELQFNHPKYSKHQLIILASVVEKETGAAWERPTIAGVFYNRLNKPMRLQSDPTTIYGIWEEYNGNLRKKHLQEKTPYNTYRVNGLPKGPISNPGIEAIKAVLFPEKHKYYYFVSLNDGTHKFTTTYREHLKAVEAYQKNPKARRGKSWRDLKKKDP